MESASSSTWLCLARFEGFCLHLSRLEILGFDKNGSGRDPGPSGPSPVTDLLRLLLANVNSTQAFTNMEAIWATDRYFDFARFQQTARNVAEMMRQVAWFSFAIIVDLRAQGVTSPQSEYEKFVRLEQQARSLRGILEN